MPKPPITSRLNQVGGFYETYTCNNMYTVIYHCNLLHKGFSVFIIENTSMYLWVDCIPLSLFTSFSSMTGIFQIGFFSVCDLHKDVRLDSMIFSTLNDSIIPYKIEEMHLFPSDLFKIRILSHKYCTVFPDVSWGIPRGYHWRWSSLAPPSLLY